MILKGEKAPNFILEDNHGNMVNLSDFRGKKVLMSWHPQAWTGVCTDQMRALETNKDKLAALNTVALGMNVDPVPSKKAWAAVLSIRDTQLLSDFYPHGAVAKDFEVFLEDIGCSKRCNILLDEQGIVVWAKEYPISQLPDMEEVLRAIAQA